MAAVQQQGELAEPTKVMQGSFAELQATNALVLQKLEAQTKQMSVLIDQLAEFRAEVKEQQWATARTINYNASSGCRLLKLQTAPGVNYAFPATLEAFDLMTDAEVSPCCSSMGTMRCAFGTGLPAPILLPCN